MRLEQVLSVSPVQENDEMFLVIPRNLAHPVGILISSLVDIEEVNMELDTRSVPMDGLLGSAMIHDVLTLFLDIPRLLNLFEPEWFAEQAAALA
jgi:two-component system chemotaxis sensor kinase CheA